MRKLIVIASLAAMSIRCFAGLSLPAMNVDSLLAEDEARNSHRAASMFRSSSVQTVAAPFRFGVSTELNIPFLDYAERNVSEAGREVLTYDIDAANAKMTSVYFSEFHLMPGDTLYMVGEDGYFVGPYTSKHNLESGVLPTAMVESGKVQLCLLTNGKKSSSRKLTIGRVNQAYRDFRRVPYQNSSTSDECSSYEMGRLEQVAQSVCIIVYATSSGVYSCCGTLMNNTAGNSRPYVLTAAHCIDTNDKASTAVFYFNYASPLGNSSIRGSMETYCVASSLRAFDSMLDFSLVELSSIPERDFRPFFAGWSLTTTPVVPAYGIHHPNSTVRRLATTNNTLSTVTFHDGDAGTYLYENGCWLVSRWTVGTTEAGSSGSPLFDNSLRLIGSLTGGGSVCASPLNDAYSKINLAWSTNSESSKQLKAWLDPENMSVTAFDGLNPYGDDSCRRMTNLTSSDEFTNSFTAPASSSMVAQGFSSETDSYLYGVYLVTASSSLPGEIYVYNDLDASPIYTQTVSTPIIAEVMSVGNIQNKAKTGIKNADTYNRFNTPVAVDDKFYVAYSTSGSFVPYAAQTASPDAVAYAKIGDEWKTLTDAGSTQNVVWIDAVTSPNPSRVTVNEVAAKKSGLSISPNPVRKKYGSVKVSADTDALGSCTIEVYDMNLRKVMSLSTYSETSEIDVNIATIPAGVYALKILSENSAFVGKLVVTE